MLRRAEIWRATTGLRAPEASVSQCRRDPAADGFLSPCFRSVDRQPDFCPREYVAV